MLTLLLTIFAVVFIAILVYLNLPKPVIVAARNGPPKTSVIKNDQILQTFEDQLLNFKNTKKEILSQLEQIKTSVDKRKLVMDIDQSSHLTEKIDDIKTHLEAPIRDITLLKTIIDPLKDKLSLSEISNYYSIINDIQTKVETLLSNYMTPLNEIKESLNDGFNNIVSYKDQILNKVELIKTFFLNTSPLSESTIVSQVVGKLKEDFELSIDKIKEIKTLINEKLSNTNDDRTKIMNQLENIKVIINNGNKLDITTPIGNLEKTLKTQLGLPVKEIIALKNLFNQKVLTITNDKTTIINKLDTIGTSLGSLGSLGRLSDLENNLKNFFKIPIKNIDELKSILTTIKDNLLLNSDLDKLYNSINNIETKIKNLINTDIEKPLIRINGILNQFENTDLRGEVTSLGTTLKQETNKILSELALIKTSLKNLDGEKSLKSSCDTNNIIQALNSLENNFKQFMTNPITKISEISNKVATFPEQFSSTQSKQEIINELSSLKQTLEITTKDINEIKNIFIPIKETLTRQSLAEVVKLITGIDEKVARKINTQFSKFKQDSVIDHINAKDREIKQYLKNLNKNTDLVRSIQLFSSFIDELGKENLPIDVANVFFAIQKLCKHYEEYEKLIKTNLNLDKTHPLSLNQLLDSIKNVQRSAIRDIIGTDFVSFKDSIDKLVKTTINKEQFQTLTDMVLNSTDANFQRIEDKLGDGMKSINENIDYIKTSLVELSSAIDGDLSRHRTQIKEAIQLLKSDLEKISNKQTAEIIKEIKSKKRTG